MDAIAIIPRYQLIEKLYAGSRTVVYRGIREVDQLGVVVKLLQRDYPTFSELLQFRNQYTIAKNLDSPGIIRPYSLETYRNSYALVMEDFGGTSLRDYVQNQPLASTEFLEIAIQLADILNYLHHHQIIHKDIKPANILIHPETKQVKIIDFSIASLLPKETQEIKNPNVLEGTLAYLAPEQTGRMNRGIDYRADFYALGVTFFELLTGQLPFLTDDPMELLHCHIAKQPDQFKIKNDALYETLRVACFSEGVRGLANAALTTFKNEETVPQVLCDIVMKLMAKNAEDRYQSALGLKYDLQTCLEQLNFTDKIKTFKIATRDVCDRFLLREKLYGRENEVQQLLAAFERVANPPESPLGKGGLRGVELMLVAGFSGIGKTAVVNEVHKPILKQRGYFIKGKFDQFNRNIPFSAFVQAFRNLMMQLLTESDQQLHQWKTSILEAVGENGQVIIEVIPELEIIIGQQLPAPKLSGNGVQNRFNLLFQKFVEVFTTKEHPLVMFLDDLQWADSASLKLMRFKSNLI
nr:AAA family ATPase [Nostoc mirabile]